MKQIVAVALISAAFVSCGRQEARPNRAGGRLEAALKSASGTGSARPVYPYSVVPGGVQNSEEVRRAIEADAGTAAHYSGVDIAKLERTSLATETRAYVSFRKNGSIFWTRRQVILPAGERILFDGRNCVRTRCGNRIAYVPQEPTLPEPEPEPTSEILNTPSAHGFVLDEVAPPLAFEVLSSLPPVTPQVPEPLWPAEPVVALEGANGFEGGPAPMSLGMASMGPTPPPSGGAKSPPPPLTWTTSPPVSISLLPPVSPVVSTNPPIAIVPVGGTPAPSGPGYRVPPVTAVFPHIGNSTPPYPANLPPPLVVFRLNGNPPPGEIQTPPPGGNPPPSKENPPPCCQSGPLPAGPPSTVPEPWTGGLVAAGGLALAALHRIRR